VYISEVHCCIAKSPNLSIILPLIFNMYKKYKNIKVLKIKKYRVVMATFEREPAFSIGKLLLLLLLLLVFINHLIKIHIKFTYLENCNIEAT
jgi:4-hydroxybenzoate polyprenyltransferase